MSSDYFVAFDAETRLFLDGLLAPPIVIGSFADADRAWHAGVGADGYVHADLVVDELARHLRAGATIIGANIAFDFGVVGAHAPELLPEIFQAYDDGRVFDVLIAVLLDLIAGGYVRDGALFDPRHGGPLMTPKGKRAERLSLEVCVDLLLNRVDAKKNDFWRTRYAVLERVPFDQWPADARQYPLDDARNTYDVAAEIVRRAERGEWRNLHNLKAQARAAFAMHLACIWGLRTDAAAVDAVEHRARTAYAAAVERFAKLGLIQVDDEDPNAEPKQHGPTLKRLVALAYGAADDSVCPVCNGVGKVPSPKSGNAILCKASAGGCDATKLDLSTAPALPRTDSGGVATDRDTLKECGYDELEKYGAVSEVRKLLDTYVPYLRRGTEVPINPRANVLVASGRTSYDGLIQLMPRGGGVRECFVPRPGRVFCSIDYNALELCTLAQCCFWIVGRSDLGDAINSGLDPHTLFASQMFGVPYDELLKQVKSGDKVAKGRRQAAKAGNFGLPGGMGAATLVLAQRKIGLRFCVAIEGAEVCGVEKITEWRRKTTPPICKRCVELAEELRFNWFKQWPEMRSYFEFVSRAVDTYGELEQFISRRVRGGLNFCNGANTLFQGLAADGAKHALYLVTRECYVDRASPLFGTRPVIFVHDEILSEMCEETAHLAAPRKAAIMVSAMQQYTPDVKQRAEPVLMRRWYKDAQPVFDSEGRLVPWEPEEKEA